MGRYPQSGSEQRSRGAEEQRSRGAEEQRSRGAEEQRSRSVRTCAPRSRCPAWIPPACSRGRRRSRRWPGRQGSRSASIDSRESQERLSVRAATPAVPAASAAPAAPAAGAGAGTGAASRPHRVSAGRLVVGHPLGDLLQGHYLIDRCRSAQQHDQQLQGIRHILRTCVPCRATARRDSFIQIF